MIPEDVIERVREAADIVEVIGEHVKLKRVGNDFRGPCPFHGGKNPNFSVVPRTGFYHCFTCGTSGTVFTFLQRHLGFEYVEAIRLMGERYGVPVPQVDARLPAERDEREPLREVLAAATELFQGLLWADSAAAAARSYLAGREISQDLADKFALGYSPADGTALRKRLEGLGFSDRRQVEVGLLVERESGGLPRPRFRDRLMLPIADIQGRTVGFGGRLLGEGQPKYLNSPETPLFSKGRLLYNLHRAKQHIRKEDRVLVVEGYFDVIRLSAVGLENAVAPLGTALTNSQAALLGRYSKNVFLLYDSDGAGQKATFRAGLELLQHGISARVVSLPPGEDPDTYVAKFGAEGMERALSAAIDLFDRQIQIAERRGWFADLHRKRRAVDKLLPTIRAAADAVTRELYIARLSEVSGIDRQALVDEVQQGARSPIGRPSGGVGASAPQPVDGEEKSRQFDPGRSSKVGPGSTRRSWGGKGRFGRFREKRETLEISELVDLSTPKPGAEKTRKSEQTLVLAMIHCEGYIESIARRVSEERFRDPILATIFSKLSTSTWPIEVEDLSSTLPAETIPALQDLLQRRDELTAPHRMVEDSLAKLDHFELQERLSELETQMKALSTKKPAGYESLLQALEQERAGLLNEKRRLGVSARWKIG